MPTSRYAFGQWMDDTRPLDVSAVTKLCETALKQQNALSRYPIDKTLRLFGRLRQRWADPSFAPRREMEAILPERTGFSREMISLGMAELVAMLDPRELRKKLSTELRQIPRGLSFHFDERSNALLRWHPLGTVLHVCSGNVFLVGPSSLIEGLITGNVSILKNPSGETTFLPTFARTLLEIDEDQILSRSFAIIDYASSQKDIIQALSARVDGVAVWGGADAVAAYRENLPASTRLIVFGPKLSVGLVTRQGLLRETSEAVGRRLAAEIAIWDQNACTAPQVCFVEGKGEAHQLATTLARALEEEQKRLPLGDLSVDAAVEIRKLRSVAEVAEGRGEGLLLDSGATLKWTVVVDDTLNLETSPLHRTIRIVPFENLDTLLNIMRTHRGYLQTVGLIASMTERLSLSRRLGELGALRVVDIGLMGGGSIDDPHDGMYALPQFLNLVVSRFETAHSCAHPMDLLARDERLDVINERLRQVVDIARGHDVYKERLKGVSIEGTHDLPKIPPLERPDMERLMNPATLAARSRLPSGGYITRSGGSTGDPKFSHFDDHDWSEMVQHATRMFRACGVVAGDRVANTMFAGDLYGSFLSFDHVNHELGVTSFGFASAITAESLLDIWRRFDINVIQGFPTRVVPLLREAKNLEPRFVIDKVMYGGQVMSPTDIEWLRRDLGATRVHSIFGSTEAGSLGYQCECLTGTREHHLLDEYNWVEIVDDEGHVLPDGEVGHLAVTTLTKWGYPLLRYRIGDTGRILTRECACGRTSRLIDYLGRADDILCIGMMNIQYRDLCEALHEFPLTAIQMVGSFKDGIECLSVHAETEAPNDALREAVYAAICSGLREFQLFLDNKALVLEVILSAPGELPRNPRTGKLKQIVDQRH
jgi:phenylacetate-CoA ligase